MARDYRIEHRSVTPPGWKVRTVSRDGHRVRIAFPPGPRRPGGGKVVEILHPRNENPCRLRNPAELLIMSANPTVTIRERGRPPLSFHAGGLHETTHTPPGEPIPAAKMRRALAGGYGPLGKRQAVLAQGALAKGRRTATRHRKNPSDVERATELYGQFHGHPSQYIDEYSEPTPRLGTLTQLGDLLELRTLTDAGWKWRSLDFTGRGVKLASNPEGTQLYFIGGDQRVGALAPFGADRGKSLIDLGECCYIAYRARKSQVNNISAGYEHLLGEETGVRPRLLYDRRGREPRLHLAGGAYHVEGRGIVN